MDKVNEKKDGWSPEELGEQSSYEGETEIARRLRRGNETAGDPNARDVAGVVPEEDISKGRKASDNGNKSDEEKSPE